MVAAALPPHATLYAALVARDAGFEGMFFAAVRTTRVFCRPTCPARKPRPENVEFFASPDEALAAGFRPCLRCRPLAAPGETPDWVRRAVALANRDPRQRIAAADLRAAGIDPERLRAWFKRHFGTTFARAIRAGRLASALGAIDAGDDALGAAFEHGWSSASAFRDAAARQRAALPADATPEPATFALLPSPLGPLLAVATAHGLALLEFLDRPALTGELEDLARKHAIVAAPGESPLLDRTRRALEAYFAGSPAPFDLPLDLRGSDFELRVWRELLTIPRGTTRSYGEIAAALGRPGAARAVGLANGRNRIAIVVPCHRVIGADGALVGYGGGQVRKAHLLRLEGALGADLFAAGPDLS
jgi:AraC family transcriptional regulator of adaptative response/methylated-DNA-[protein]-cysteine methyltransferase